MHALIGCCLVRSACVDSMNCFETFCSNLAPRGNNKITAQSGRRALSAIKRASSKEYQKLDNKLHSRKPFLTLSSLRSRALFLAAMRWCCLLIGHDINHCTIHTQNTTHAFGTERKK